jgi:hypothetical protein
LSNLMEIRLKYEMKTKLAHLNDFSNILQKKE